MEQVFLQMGEYPYHTIAAFLLAGLVLLHAYPVVVLALPLSWDVNLRNRRLGQLHGYAKRASMIGLVIVLIAVVALFTIWKFPAEAVIR